MIAFPCSTFSIARFFDATTGLIDWPVTNDTSGRGPPPVRTSLHPDGLPEGELNPRHVKELGVSNRLLDRTAEIAIAAHRSPRRTTIVFENPADRTDEGAPHLFEASYEGVHVYPNTLVDGRAAGRIHDRLLRTYWAKEAPLPTLD